MGLQSWTQLNNMSTLGLSGWALNAVTSVRVRGGVVQSLSRVRLFATPWTAARQASLSITSSRSLLKLMSTESVLPSSHLVLCCPLLLLPSVFPSIRVFPNELAHQVAKVRRGHVRGRRPPCVYGGRHWGDNATRWGHLEPQKLEEAGRAVLEPLEGASPAHTSTSDSTLQPGRE